MEAVVHPSSCRARRPSKLAVANTLEVACYPFLSRPRSSVKINKFKTNPKFFMNEKLLTVAELSYSSSFLGGAGGPPSLIGPICAAGVSTSVLISLLTSSALIGALISAKNETNQSVF